MITFVLPTKGELDIYKAFNILIPSIEKYFDLNDLAKFYIIYNNSDYNIIHSWVNKSNTNLHIECINETDILRDNASFYKLSGWRKQQLLKLEISKLIKTEYYLTLDSDLFVIKKCGLNNFFIDNKIIYNHSLLCHREWWEASSKLLNCDFELYKNRFTFSVTPCILVTNIVQELLDYLNLSDYNIFTNNTFIGWSEYTLYWIFAVQKDYDKLFYMDDKYKYTYSIYGFCIWHPLNTKNIPYIYELILNNNINNNCFFSLVQSNTNILSTIEEVDEFKKLLLND
jgi:hypothetical protein